MIFNFLFWVFFVGIIVASFQDLKRMEIDDWLNLFLVFSGFVFIFYKAIFEKDISIIFQAGFALVIMFLVMNLFYYGRVFGGGDAKLLFSMTAFFVGASFYTTLVNMFTFIFLLMFSGSIYGLFFSFVLYFNNRDKVNKEVAKVFDNRIVKQGLIVGAVLFMVGLFFHLFFIVAIFSFVFIALYVFTKALENVSMIKSVPVNKLREGDLLAEDVKLGNKIIKANWDGLSLNEIKLLEKKRKVKIKGGLQFAPAFFIAFIIYVFLKSWLFGLFLI